MPSILAIDQGTTSTKAYVSIDGGAARLVGSRTHRQIRPYAGWVEHDPIEISNHVLELATFAGSSDAIGLANQGETVVAWDAETKRPLYNAIVWQDERTREDVERLRSAGLEALTLERAGLPLDPYFSASRLRWLLDNAEDARSLARTGRLRIGTSDAFLLDRICGAFCTDVSTASRTSLVNLSTLQWDQDLCEAFGVPIELLPAILPTTGAFGEIGGGGAISASAVDQQAALFGHDSKAGRGKNHLRHGRVRPRADRGNARVRRPFRAYPHLRMAAWAGGARLRSGWRRSHRGSGGGMAERRRPARYI